MPLLSRIGSAASRGFGLFGLSKILDPYFKYVTLLLHGDGTNGAQNNTFLDSSTNNFTITRNGNTTQGTFSPYGANWSNYFNGSTDFINAPASTALGFGTSNFTMEMWVFSGANGTSTRLGGNGTGGAWAANKWIISTSTPGNVDKFVLGTNNFAGDILASTSAFNNNKWMHVAITRSGNSWAMFVNGTRESTATSSTSLDGGGSNTLYLGKSNVSGDAQWAGYISNFRVVIGTAVYDPASTTITVPTTPLTAITNTQLLTCQSNRFIDNSSNALAISTGGSPSIQRFSPFSPSTAYSTSVIGGSGYFDGSGDYLTTPQNAAFNIGTGQFTVEAFVYWNGTTLASGGYGIISLGNGANGGSPVTYVGWTIQINFDTGGKPTWYRYDGTEYSYGSSINLPANQWVHLAVSRNSSNTLSMWMNGVRVYTGTSTVSFNNVNSDPLNLGYRFDGGAGSPHYFPGYISNARVVVGTDVYGAANSTITVPTAPLTAVSGTAFLTNFTNGAIYDNAEMNNLETVGSAQVSTTQVKFGTGSMYFPGTTSDYLKYAASTYVSGTEDFTVECWIYLSNVTAGATKVIIGGVQSNSLGFRVGQSYTGNVNGLSIYKTNISDNDYCSFSFSASTWYHVAVTRQSSTIRFFVNGTQQTTLGTSVGAFSFVAPSTVYGGIGGTLLEPFAGYIDDMRVTKGYARYTSNFTPPTAAFPNQ